MMSEQDKWFDYIQEDMLFKGIQLLITRGSVRDNSMKQKHSGGLAREFGINKTVKMISKRYTKMFKTWLRVVEFVK